MFNIQSYFVTLCENQRKMGRNSVKPGAVRRENVSGSWHRCRQPAAAAAVNKTMKIKTFGAMVVEKPHFWLTNYQILIVLQFPHICKHTRKQTYCVRVVFPFSNSPPHPGLGGGSVSYFELHGCLFYFPNHQIQERVKWNVMSKSKSPHLSCVSLLFWLYFYGTCFGEKEFFALHFWQKMCLFIGQIYFHGGVGGQRGT